MNDLNVLYLAQMTNKQLDRLFRRVYSVVYRRFHYQAYGIDWPTLNMCYPHLCYVLRSILDESKRRSRLVIAR
jgi:hypothetical protein